MTNYLLKSLPPQSAALYGFLKEKKPMTAKNIGKKLDMFPHAVYRAMKPLTELGIVKQLNSYPVSYEAKPVNDAVDFSTAAIRQNFLDAFGKQTKGIDKPLDISFIQNRNDLLEKTNTDIAAAEKEVNFLVSGLEVPAETILVFKQAVERGVEVKALVQQMNETSKKMFKNWKKIGVQVRYFPNMETRIFIIDGRIVYFTSYNPEKKDEANGMRFNYIPYAKLMSEVFEQRWHAAKKI
jgi:sugar-specific transcriptional regulator TrmB